MSESGGRADDVVTLVVLLAYWALDGGGFAERERLVLQVVVVVVAGRAQFLARLVLVAAVAEAADGRHGDQEQSGAEADAHHGRSAHCINNNKGQQHPLNT